MTLFLLTLGYTATIAFYIWTKEWAIKHCVKFWWSRKYIVHDRDIKYHWTDYAAMLMPMINISFALANLFYGLCFKYRKVNMLRRFGINC